MFCCGKKVAQTPLSTLLFLGWVGLGLRNFVGFIITSVCFPTQHNFGKSETPYGWVCRLVDHVVGRPLIGLFVDWSVDWSVDHFVGRPSSRSVDRPVDWLVDLSVGNRGLIFRPCLSSSSWSPLSLILLFSWCLPLY